MGRYLARRIVHGVVVLLGVSIIVFTLMHLSGDPVAVLLPLDTPPEQVEAFRQEMGFDKALPVQYLMFLSRALRGDFGYSYHYRTDAMSVVLERLPATIRLTFAALLVWIIGLLCFSPGNGFGNLVNTGFDPSGMHDHAGCQDIP